MGKTLSVQVKRKLRWLEMPEQVVETNAANWDEEVVKSEKLVLVEFWHPQCPHCIALAPVFAQLAREYEGKLRFAKLNVMGSPENQELAIKYGIMGTPTLKFFCGGRPVQEIVGVLGEDHLRQGIEFAVKKHRECAEKSTSLNLPYIS